MRLIITIMLLIEAAFGLYMLALFAILSMLRGFGYAWDFMIGDPMDEIAEQWRKRKKR